MLHKVLRLVMCQCAVVAVLIFNPAKAANFLLVGDSLSAAHNIDSTMGWVNLLAETIENDDELPNNLQLVNASISGDTTANGLGRFSELLQQYEPGWVILALGANDALQGLPFATMSENMATMIEQAQSDDSAVLLLVPSLPANFGPVYEQQFHGSFVQLARTYEVPLIIFSMEMFIDRPELMQDDGLHPTAEAQLLIVEQLWPDIRTWLLDTDVVNN